MAIVSYVLAFLQFTLFYTLDNPIDCCIAFFVLDLHVQQPNYPVIYTPPNYVFVLCKFIFLPKGYPAMLCLPDMLFASLLRLSMSFL